MGGLWATGLNCLRPGLMNRDWDSDPFTTITMTMTITITITITIAIILATTITHTIILTGSNTSHALP